MTVTPCSVATRARVPSTVARVAPVSSAAARTQQSGSFSFVVARSRANAIGCSSESGKAFDAQGGDGRQCLGLTIHPGEIPAFAGMTWWLWRGA